MIPVYKPYLTEKERNNLISAFDSSWISSRGSFLESFGKSLANFTNLEHVNLVSNGTVALHLALIALDIGPGDEVLLPDFSYVASANAVKYVGATPVFVDANNSSWQMNLEDLELKINSRSKAIIAVHTYGNSEDMNSIVKIKESLKKFHEEHPNHFETYREKLKESMKKVDISKCTKESEKFQKAVREGRVGAHGPTSEEKKQKIREGVLRYYQNGGTNACVNIEKHREVMTKARGKPVAQYTVENVFVKDYPSIKNAGRNSGISSKCIQHALKIIGRKGEFLWKYITE